MICTGCGHDKAYAVQTRHDGEKFVQGCNRCSGVSGGGVPDVYFKGAYWDHNIASEDHPGPKFITSRGQKKVEMDRCGLREAGDRVHGATSFDKISHRHAQESLRR